MIIDWIALVLGLVALLLMLWRWRRIAVTPDARLFLLPVVLLTVLRGISDVVTPWYGLTDDVVATADSIEDFVEIFMPVSLFFFLYGVIQSQRRRELVKKEESVRITLQSIADAVIVTDCEGRVLNMNAVAERMTEWRLDEVAGTPVASVFRLRDPTTSSMIECPVRRSLTTGEIQVLANHALLVSRNGSERQIADSVAPIRDNQGVLQGAVLIFRDVSEQYENQQRIQQSEAQLRHALKELRLYSERLEEAVAERTADLSRQNAALEDALHDLAAAQTHLVQSAKVATLGRLAAGIAHEISNPLGAIGASVDVLLAKVEELVDRPPICHALAEPDVHRTVVQLLEKVRHPGPLGTTRARRVARHRLMQLLDRRGTAEAERIADILSELEATDETEQWIPLLERSDAMEVLEWTRRLAAICRSGNIIRLAAGQTAKIMYVLRSHIHQTPREAMQKADLRQSIEDVLLLYQNKLQDRVEVERRYEPLALVECRVNDIMQVWTNLIHNAIQAMPGGGRLTVSLRQEGDEAVIAFDDTGQGIPPELQSSIFEPLFTTKAAGEGCGLGLHIVKTILEQHKGRIDFESEVGVGTRFTVRLPLQQPEKLDVVPEPSLD